jgi:nicotinamidase-related amidase
MARKDGPTLSRKARENPDAKANHVMNWARDQVKVSARSVRAIGWAATFNLCLTVGHGLAWTPGGMEKYAAPADSALPASDMQLDLARTALVVTDPQIDFLSPSGVTWGVVGESVRELDTVANRDRLFSASKKAGIIVAISPHYYYPTDKGWKFEGALEKLMHTMGMFDRRSAYSTEGFENSGADFLPHYKQYILDGKTVIASPHKVYGPQQNDLALQLRKQRVDQVILAGMSANLCVEAHLRELLEQGFEVAVVRDATAAARIPDGDGYLAALTNFRFIANAVWTTEEAIARLENRE